MTEKQVQILGFEKTKEYLHDNYFIRLYRKGVIEVEFTYESAELVTVDISLDKVNYLPAVKIEELKSLDLILNKIL